MFILLLKFCGSSLTKFLSLGNKTCMPRSTLTYFNAVDDLSTKICVSSKTKDINVKVFDMITKIHQAEILVKHIACHCE